MPSSHPGDGVERAFGAEFSSRPPSSDPPFGGGGNVTGSDVGRRDGGPSEGATPPGAKAPPSSGRKPGKQPGAKGTWRAEDGTYRKPLACAHCGLAFEMWDVRTAEAFAVLELERTDSGIRIGCVQHRYEVMRCACGRETVPASACSRSREAALAGDRTQRPVVGRLYHGLGAINPAAASVSSS